MEELLWRNRFGETTPLLKMETSYLYNTVKMIWNNVLFWQVPFGDVISWKFDRNVYPETYLHSVFLVGCAELVKRKDPTTQAFLEHVNTHTASRFLKYIENDVKFFYEFRAGTKVRKSSGKPFKSTFKVNTVSGHLIDFRINRLMLLFQEDGSTVEAHRCEKV